MNHDNFYLAWSILMRQVNMAAKEADMFRQLKEQVANALKMERASNNEKPTKGGAKAIGNLLKEEEKIEKQNDEARKKFEECEARLKIFEAHFMKAFEDGAYNQS